MPKRPLNVVLLVIDSLRAQSLAVDGAPGLPATPNLERLETESISFRRAYAAECWTLPAHASMFTGLLPSQHGAHFQTMAYTSSAPTVAEQLSTQGYDTEVITRNFIFDGTIPGLTRGFQRNTRLLSPLGKLNPFTWILTLSKPRSRRLMRSTGFFHPQHRSSREFLTSYTRGLMPADPLSLTYLLEQMSDHRRGGRPYFAFCNLYDVHWPYSPSPHTVLRPWTSARGLIENLAFPVAVPSIGSHGYLRDGFRIPERRRRMLLRRYHDAIQLMDTAVGNFVDDAKRHGLLDDTLLIVTSDHGEAFGDHGLYLHDGSLYNTHLHVPLWVHHPRLTAQRIDDVVSTRDLHGLMLSATGNTTSTILDADYRAQHPIAVAEHFYYPHVKDIAPRYAQNITAAISASEKLIVRSEGPEHYAAADRFEQGATGETLEDFAARCHKTYGGAADTALQHLRQWNGGIGST